MLAVQTADENLYVPDGEIASLTPVYPNRTRVVLANGTVAHRPGPPPAGPWVPLHDSWVTPALLTKQGDYWKDPGDYLYPYQPLPDLVIEEEPTDLPDGLISFEFHDGAYCWRTDSGYLECDLKPKQALQIYPQLCYIDQAHLINLLRVRRFGGRAKGGWIELDNGERFKLGDKLAHSVAQSLGSQSMSQLDPDQTRLLLRLRDFPYDLTSGDPERIRRDCPTAQLFTYNLLWQVVIQNLRGQPNDYGRNYASFALHPLASAGARCGYSLNKKDLGAALARLVTYEGLIQYRYLGFEETDPDRRRVGSTRPEVLLVAPLQRAQEARQAAQEWGLSLLLSKRCKDQLPLENLSTLLKSPLTLLFYSVKASQQNPILNILKQLEMSWAGTPTQLDSLSNLGQVLKDLPKLYGPEPTLCRRIALQAANGQLLMADPEEIACWSPTRFSRWRVVLCDGQVVHHPGPVPSGPWVLLGEHWVQPQFLDEDRKDRAGFQLPDLPIPAPPEFDPLPPIQAGPSLPCPPERVLWLDGGYKGTWWHLDDGRKIQVDMGREEAAFQHPGLLRFSRTLWTHHNRIRYISLSRIVLDNGQELPMIRTRHTDRVKDVLGIPAFDFLAPDPGGLLRMGLRDFPFEIARAPSAVLRRFFPTPHLLINNILYQTFDIYQKTGVFPYGNTFSGYFYRPLLATLSRAGFLTRAQFRAPWRADSAKDRLQSLFGRAILAMVYHGRLFTYQQFGFKDPFPEDRIVGTRRPHQILLVEKGDKLEAIGRQLQEYLGLTLLILKGNPSVLATEYFAEELKKHGIYEVEVHFYGDFDYVGWDIGPVFIRQLRFYGIKSSKLTRLVLPECFTKEELPVVSRAIDIPAPNIASRVQRWIQEGGGIAGEARGIHANWLFPFNRVLSRLEELLS